MDNCTIIAIAVDREQYLWLDLLEAIDYALCAKFGRATGPDGTHAGCGQEGDDGFGDIGHIVHDAIAALHTQFAQCCGYRSHVACEVLPGKLGQWACL